ncbi:MAG: hypothetical protein R3307_07130 [Anaerolineales bacterium]|nr:hypothetical protein [Anaerolineales bacterium]
MKTIKLSSVLFIALTVLVAQAGAAFAAPALQEGPITGTVTALDCGPDSENPTVVVTLDVEGESLTVEIALATAVELGLIAPDTACSPEALADAIGAEVSIDPSTVIQDEEEVQHPVGSALSEYFSDITDYETIMAAHEDGTGFGVLAQALWLTMNMEGDSETFLAIVEAKKTKDFSAFVLEDGSIPKNWGQFKKAALNGDKKGNLGVVMSGRDKDKTNNGNNGQDEEKSNNGKGSENSNKNKDKDKKK